MPVCLTMLPFGGGQSENEAKICLFVSLCSRIDSKCNKISVALRVQPMFHLLTLTTSVTVIP
jgi:hypothetical protein